MKIAIMASLPAKGNVDINTCHCSELCNVVESEMTKLKEYLYYYLFVLWLLPASTIAQQSCRLMINVVDASHQDISNLKLTTEFSSKQNCLTYVQRLPSLLMTKGYISASIDSLWEDSSSVNLLLFTGEKYVWDSLHVDQKDWPLLNNLGYYATSFNNKPFDQQKVNDVYNDLLDYYSNNGYPFARIYLDSLILNNSHISAALHINEGTLYHVDTIIIKGNLKLSKDFLTRYLDIREHSVYRQNKLNNIDNRLAELSFVQQTEKHSVTMLNTGAALNLYLQNRPSNQVYALIGFLPNNQQTGGKLLVTGEANLNLHNPFGNGESLGINWQQLQPKSPRLNIFFQRPYIFHSPVDINLNFQLYKRDSFFLNIYFLAGIQYNISAKQSVNVFTEFTTSNLLSVDTTAIKFTKQLPDIVDYTAANLSVQYNFNNTNYRFNPRRGNELMVVSGFGRKHIRENNTIVEIKDTSFNYKSLYDTVQQNGYEFKTRLSAAHYFPTGKQSTLKTAFNGGWLQSPNYFQNELFQIGGHKLLRGFDEESIYSNLFAIGTLEYRYLLAQNSYLFSFADFGYATYKSNSAAYDHFYIGTGAGLAFETGKGILNISYAIGKRDDQRFDLRQSKIHIGFVSLF